jgi:hypothetical protein
MTWQPIETAPKDGTVIILWRGNPWNEVAMARWFEPWATWLRADDPDPICETDEMYGMGSAIPTHWQPLPEPPCDPLN